MGVAAVLVALAGASLRSIILPMLFSGPEPKSAILLLDTLRKMPSKTPDLTVEARMAKELEESRRLGNLLSYQGWHIKPVAGSNSKFLIVFSYRENDDSVHVAEWQADSSERTFTPQTDLARAVYGE